MIREKERGTRKTTDKARKWREWALIMRFDSDNTPQRLRGCEEVVVDMREQRLNCFFLLAAER